MTPSDRIDGLITAHPDWRGQTLADARRMILEVDPDITEAQLAYGTKVVAVEPGGVEPIPDGERHGRPVQLLWTWSSPNFEFATIAVGILSVLAFGLTFWQAVGAIVLGTLLEVIEVVPKVVGLVVAEVCTTGAGRGNGGFPPGAGGVRSLQGW